MPHHFVGEKDKIETSVDGSKFWVILSNDFCGNDEKETAMDLSAAERICNADFYSDLNITKISIANESAITLAAGAAADIKHSPAAGAANVSNPTDTKQHEQLRTALRALLTVVEKSRNPDSRKQAAAAFVKLDTETYPNRHHSPFIPANPCHTARCLYIQAAIERKVFSDLPNTIPDLALTGPLRDLSRQAKAINAAYLPDLIYYAQMAQLVTQIVAELKKQTNPKLGDFLLSNLVSFSESRALTMTEFMRCFLEDAILSDDDKLKFLINTLLDTNYICNKAKKEELKEFFAVLREVKHPTEKEKTWAQVLKEKLPHQIGLAAIALSANKDVIKQTALTRLAAKIDPQTDHKRSADDSKSSAASVAAPATVAVIPITADNVIAAINEVAPKGRDEIFAGYTKGITGSTVADFFLTVKFISEGLTNGVATGGIANDKLRKKYDGRTLFEKAASVVPAPAASPAPAPLPATVSAPSGSAAAMAASGSPTTAAGAAAARTPAATAPSTAAPAPAPAAPSPA